MSAEPTAAELPATPPKRRRPTFADARSRFLDVWVWLEGHPVRTLVICLCMAAAIRLPFIDVPLQPDEGGFLMVAGQWHGHGDSLYTNQWVDRPPLLILVFKLATLLGDGPVTIRLMSLVFGSVTIVGAWWAGRLINGLRGATSAAVVAAALGASYQSDGFALTGETIASAFVMTSCALALEARFGGRTRLAPLVLAFLSGLCASCAFLTKQNFIDAGIFSAILLVARPRRNWHILSAGLAGLLMPLAITAWWALSPAGPGLGRLLVAIFRFRQRSTDVIFDSSLGEPLERLRALAIIFVAMGLIVLLVQVVRAARRTQHSRGLRVALVVMLAYDVISVLLGASWWTHYLLQFTVPLSLGIAVATRAWEKRSTRTFPATYVAIASIVASLVPAAYFTISGTPPGSTLQTLGNYLKAASKPGDSVVVTYGAANVIQDSGLTTPYRYAWSLPVRTRDPKLDDLVSVLDSSEAPTWIAEVLPFDTWGLDNARFADARADHYRLVATVCGYPVYQRDDLARQLPPTPTC